MEYLYYISLVYFHFGEKEKAAFDFMVSSLSKFPVVYILDVQKALYTICDGAAGDSISYVIMQFHAALNSFVPCRFVSHRLNRTQQRYPQVQAEVLSISLSGEIATVNYAATPTGPSHVPLGPVVLGTWVSSSRAPIELV